ncbi:hypothetical protein BC936DRAFT_147114 [Jimgerdemannia flammicorona]|uniref:Uncharacterized protein n=1 Tax=Jimgerdemannia flammicorona TaxID=994334 RepID=A0A433D616_9FUNG|nr:hypothetical protein BC936DRAFT_147114 [Jimgerdemannia flammicorona]
MPPVTRSQPTEEELYKSKLRTSVKAIYQTSNMPKNKRSNNSVQKKPHAIKSPASTPKKTESKATPKTSASSTVNTRSNTKDKATTRTSSSRTINTKNNTKGEATPKTFASSTISTRNKTKDKAIPPKSGFSTINTRSKTKGETTPQTSTSRTINTRSQTKGDVSWTLFKPSASKQKPGHAMQGSRHSWPFSLSGISNKHAGRWSSMSESLSDTENDKRHRTFRRRRSTLESDGEKEREGGNSEREGRILRESTCNKRALGKL